MVHRHGMPKIREFSDAQLAALAEGQAGVLSRSQALSHGMSRHQISSRLASGTWSSTEVEGVYLTFTGPLTDLALCWVSLLYAGENAVPCRDSAAWSWTLTDELARPIHILLPISRRVLSKNSLVQVHHSLHHGGRRQPARTPPATKLDDTVLDLVDFAKRPAEVIDIVTRGCQRRLTTASRLGAEAASRKKLAWRALLIDVLTEVGAGVQSSLERGYFRDVEFAHGLPRGERNAPEGATGRRRYRDVRYRLHRLVVELDGSAAHPVEARDRDDVRDNELVETEGTATLRYGWTAIADRACETAAQVARLLRQGGWAGTPRPCGPDCPVGRTPTPTPTP
jgi:hypothetical protein